MSLDIGYLGVRVIGVIAGVGDGSHEEAAGTTSALYEAELTRGVSELGCVSSVDHSHTGSSKTTSRVICVRTTCGVVTTTRPGCSATTRPPSWSTTPRARTTSVPRSTINRSSASCGKPGSTSPTRWLRRSRSGPIPCPPVPDGTTVMSGWPCHDRRSGSRLRAAVPSPVSAGAGEGGAGEHPERLS